MAEQTGFVKELLEILPDAQDRWDLYATLAEGLQLGIEPTGDELLILGYGLFRDTRVSDLIASGVVEPIVDDVSSFLSSIDEEQARTIGQFDSAEPEELQDVAIQTLVGAGIGTAAVKGAAAVSGRAAAAAATSGRVVAGGTGAATTFKVVGASGSRSAIRRALQTALKTKTRRTMAGLGVLGAWSLATNEAAPVPDVQTLTDEEFDAETAGADSEEEASDDGVEFDEPPPQISDDLLPFVEQAKFALKPNDPGYTDAVKKLAEAAALSLDYDTDRGKAPVGGFAFGDRNVQRNDPRLGVFPRNTDLDIPIYYDGDQFELFGSLSPERVAEIQDDLITAGLINENGFRAGVWDAESGAAMSRVLTHANRNAQSWRMALQELKANPLPKDVDIETYRPASYIAPDYATLAQNVRSVFEETVGRKPREYEMQLFSAELAQQHRAAFDVQENAARAAYDTGAHIIREGGTEQAAEDAKAAAGGFQNIDPVSRFRESFLDKYGAEIDRRADVDSTREQAQTWVRSMAGMTNRVRR